LASIPPKAREAMELARRGDLAKAISWGEAAAAEAPGNAGLRLFMGLLHARQLDLPRALIHLREAAALVPDDPYPKLELARVLAGLERLDDAERVLDSLSLQPSQAIALHRIRALVLQRRGSHRDAARLYRLALDKDGRDFESWAGLGLCRLALGDAEGAIAAFGRSLELRPGQPSIRARLAEAQAAAGRASDGLAEARALARILPYDPLVRVTIARLEDLLGRPDLAEAALAEALDLDPACAPALLALADLMERDNRIDAFEQVLARIDAAGIPPPESALLRARLHYRKGELDAALSAASAAPESVAPGARALLTGQVLDRLGRPEAAFQAFTEMNRITAVETAGADRMAADFRAEVEHRLRTTTPNWYAGWSPARPSQGRPAPAFLFGVPRSGTTLLDTMLGGDPEVLVLEERPVLHAVAERLGGLGRLSGLDQAEIDALRGLYFAQLDKEAPEAAGRLVIDKLPFGILDTALVHRIFPDARIVFAERHPCDVVLSCFMTRFDPRGGMANFLDLEDTARLYHLVMDYWRRCREIFPLNVHTIRYERMVEDAEAELRPLAHFLGLGWRPELLDHRRAAAARSYIATPSYAQVTEPLYTRARGRWEKYRGQMEPVLPLLAPWAERMGCDL
jgi:tetratricopeptide (TPR) repeat protein